EYPNCKREENLEVHHIIPRSQGGRNTYDNLIVLCPTHHAMADKGGIPRSRLQYIVRHRNR
ncbi:MAG TPA: HNH endonuclease, partial [Thermoplasmatales archaeon]|nr:HNH endonuclease [Thermoplasmatales archaeon]